MDKKIMNIAVIGCSGMASGHMKGVCAREGVKLYAICDPAEERLAQRKEEFGVEIAVADYRELVNDPNLDAVVVVVPDKLHLPITKAFLEAGKAVLCEKPMAMNYAEAKKMIDDICFVPEVGKLYYGKVVRILPIGAFVEIAPGHDGMVHISKLENRRVEKVEDVLNLGDMTWVKFMGFDEKGRANFSRRDALKEMANNG